MRNKYSPYLKNNAIEENTLKGIKYKFLGKHSHTFFENKNLKKINNLDIKNGSVYLTNYSEK